jgi:tRNA G18 (ribose-2'-O)-methylase SpoU
MVTPLREETRLERYKRKLKGAQKLPFYLVTSSFGNDDNVGLIIRAGACFGAKSIWVIGKLPKRRFLRAKSGSMLDFIDIKTFSGPTEFLQHCRESDVQIYSAEIAEDSESILRHTWKYNFHSAIVIGNEHLGVPTEILHHSKKIYVPMPGFGYCLNTSQAGTVLAYDYFRQSRIQGLNGDSPV